MAILNSLYQSEGYCVYRNFFEINQLQLLNKILHCFHKNWLAQNQEAYKNGAINSAYISQQSSSPLSTEQRTHLFQFIAQQKLIGLLKTIIPEEACFLNTQLFFDPFQLNQKNYWHRDIQYTNIPESDQFKTIQKQQVLHFRVPLKTELGIELIPKTHNCWDTALELAVRKGLDNHQVFDHLPNSKTIDLNAGDLLVFSANMIHRGLYGQDRFTFDILYCDNNSEILKYATPDCFPNQIQLDQVDCPEIFTHNTLS
ncbi:MAG: phytanoyl-CoA dioxygenase [Aureispira sp.]|nr:phytanoyl-CoA dioxygenase [Aureispira sp.]